MCFTATFILNFYQRHEDALIINFLNMQMTWFEWISHYSAHVANLEQWCRASWLLTNVGETKQLIVNQTTPFSPLIPFDQTLEIINCFKYIRTNIHDKLSFNNTNEICKKASQRLFLMRVESLRLVLKS